MKSHRLSGRYDEPIYVRFGSKSDFQRIAMRGAGGEEPAHRVLRNLLLLWLGC